MIANYSGILSAAQIRLMAAIENAACLGTDPGRVMRIERRLEYVQTINGWPPPQQKIFFTALLCAAEKDEADVVEQQLTLVDMLAVLHA